MMVKCKECKHLNKELAFCRACGAKWINEKDGANCKYFEKVTAPTIFHRITESPEVLSEEFVEMMYDRVAGDYRYYSMLTGEFYNSRDEALAATVAKLKEVDG